MDIFETFFLNGSDKPVNYNVRWEEGTPYFRATEIADILKIKNIHNTIKQFNKDERDTRQVLTSSGPQNVMFLTESGLYRLLMISGKSNVRPFQKWLSHVISSIRKTGQYDVVKHEAEIGHENNNNRAITTQLKEEVTDEKVKNTLDPKYVVPYLIYANTRQHTQVKGNKIQRYSPDGKTLLETYESAIAALRDPKLDSPLRKQINDAIKNNTVYKDFRWMSLERHLPDDTFQELEETDDTKRHVCRGLVAMLSLDKTQIVEVFRNQKEAGLNRKFNGSAAINAAIKKGTQSGGHYFKMWCDCLDDLKEEFLSRKELPADFTRGGRYIAKLHPITKDLIQVYPSVAEVIKEHKFSYNSLFNVIENGFIAKGFRWEFYDNKQN